MSNDETIFTNRTNQDIDEALAWLDSLAGNKAPSKTRNVAQPRPKAAVDQFNLPTWLRMDIRVEPPKADIKEPASIEDENLNWLDNFASPAPSALEEPPTMNWQDTSVVNAGPQIRETQRELSEDVEAEPVHTVDLDALQIEDEPTSVTVFPEPRVVEAPPVDPDLQTEPVRDEPPAAASLWQDTHASESSIDTAQLERPQELDTTASIEATAPENPADSATLESSTAPVDDFVLPNIDDLLGVPLEYRDSSVENQSAFGPDSVSPERDPFLDVSEEAIADWLNSADHGTKIVPPSNELPTYEFDGFPELGDIFSREVQQDEKTDIILPQTSRTHDADLEEDDRTDIIPPQFAPSIAEVAELDDATKIVPPVTDSVEPSITDLLEAVGLPTDLDETTEIVPPATDADLVEMAAELSTDLEETAEIVPPATDADLIERAVELSPNLEETTEIVLPVADPAPEMEGTHVSLPKPTDLAPSALDNEEEDETQILPYPSLDVERDLVADALEFVAEEDGTQILPYPSNEPIVEPDSAENASDDDGTQILPYPQMQMETPIDAPESDTSGEENTQVVPYDLDILPDEILAEIQQLDEPATQDEQTRILPYESNELIEETLAELRGFAEPVEEGTEVVPYGLTELPAELVEAIESEAEAMPVVTPPADSAEDDAQQEGENTQVVPYGLEELPADLLAEVEQAVDALAESEGTQELRTATDLIDLAADEPTSIVAPAVKPTDPPEAPPAEQVAEVAKADDEPEGVAKEPSIVIPDGLDWLDGIDSTSSATASSTTELSAGFADENMSAATSAPDGATPDKDRLDTWHRAIPRDPMDIAAMSAPTIVSRVPISERWKQLGAEDTSGAEALDLIESSADSPIMDTMHAEQVLIEEVTPEQLRDLTEPADFAPYDAGANADNKPESLDLTEPVNYISEIADLAEGTNLAEVIPDDPDEAIAWLERMARQGGVNAKLEKAAAPKVVEQTGLVDDAPHFLQDLEPEEELDEPTMVTAIGKGAADEMEAFMRQLEEAMDASNDQKSAESTPPPSEPLPEELNDALAWLEDLVTGSENSLDETTVELNEADVQALLNQAIAQPILPEPEELDEPTHAPAPNPDDTPTEPLPVVSAPDPQGGELDEALAWLEAFANEESSLILPVTPDDATRAPAGAKQPVRLFHESRLRAESALELGDYKQVAREYTGLIENEKSAALEVVIEDMTRITQEVATPSPLLYRVLGDAYAKQLNFEMAAQAYRNGLDML